MLTGEPFKPKLQPHPELKVVPFELGMENRLAERREYNGNVQRQLAEKRKQVSKNIRYGRHYVVGRSKISGHEKSSEKC